MAMATNERSGRPRRWRNWSDSVRAAPRTVFTPRSLDELAQTVGRYSRERRHVRVVGDGHSFTPLAQSDDVMISLDNMQGTEAVDAEAGTARVRAAAQAAGG